MLQNNISLSFSHILVLLLYLLTNCHQAQSISYRIEFDAQFSPPSVIPKNPKDLVYSVPLNQLISKPIIVRIRDQSNNIIIPEGNPDVFVSTFDVLKWKGVTKDVWKQTGGKLCQRTLFGESWPLRLNREKYRTICGSGQDSTVLIKKFINDIIILDWISHQHPTGTVPINSRFLRVSIPDMKLTADSNPFNITVPAASLVIISQPPKVINANTGFNISAEIHDAKNKLVTEGLDSVLYVELCVPYEYKQFYHAFGKDMLIISTEIRLGGANVVTHQGTNDLVIRKQASGGKVTFTDIRILDVISKLKLNLTMYMSKDPWLRSPDCSTCYADITYKEVDEYGIVKFKPMTSSLLSKTPAVAFTREFEVIKQTLKKLILITPYEQNRLVITRNFPIPGPIYLEAQDINGNRIYSGPHANLPIEIDTVPKGVCISVDHTTYIREGYGRLKCSVCQIIGSVYLSIYSKVNPSAVANSSDFNVVGDIHVAHFDHFKYSGAGWNIEPHVNSFIRFGARDINSGIIPGVLKHFQMKIYVDTIETNNDITRTIKMYSSFRDKGQEDPSTALRAVIMPNNAKISAAMIRDVNNDEIPMISLSQKQSEFTVYHYFNRLCWNWQQIGRSFLTACKERKWTYIVVLKMANEVIPDIFPDIASKLNISFSKEVIIELFDPKNPDEDILFETMKVVKNMKSRIIFALLNATYQPIILPAAARYGLSSRDGYQWLFLSEYAYAFPINNLCGEHLTCSEAFKGSLMFIEAYNISNFHSDNWYRVLDYYLSADRTMLMGLEPSYPNVDVGSFLGIGYDAIWLFAEALNRIISRQLTATGTLIIQELREITIEGLSGILKLDNEGDRSDFIGTIRVVNTEPDRIQLIRFCKKMSHDVQVEFKYGIAPKYIDSSTNLSITVIPLPYSNVYNLRKFVSYSGGISEINNQWIEDKSEAWPPIRNQRFEKIVPQFLCRNSCGKRVTIENINLYDRGKCISMDTCECFLGYYGVNCEKVMCVCLFGHCLEPFKCRCAKGWAGKMCNKPICSFTCSNGKCVEPEVCKCTSGAWVNKRCSIHIASIIVPLSLLLAAFIYLAYIGTFWLKKYLEHKAALSDLSWLVKWSDVAKVDTAATSKVSCAFSELYSWNREKWHVKSFNSKTVDVDDARIRFDMVELVTVHHKNLITYGGACLTYPNVCLLVEPAHKGSLEDILVNESIQLGWDFRFSFMKDICAGMNFLHTKTNFHSHGRLKSSNCLLDNRWTVRLSGFGAPTLRYGPYTILTDTDDPDIYYENQQSLLWTAPELLETATCLDDIRTGTKEGDVYSFGIIISEIATRNIPFGHERDFLSVFSILDLIVDKDNPALASEREVWSSIGGDLFCVRPQVTSEQLPEGKTVKKKFKKMLDDIWCEEPTARLPFQKLTSLLNNIHPSKGELMDNLIHLLESYSSNLEHIVVERTNDLEIEKTKIDNIISQMLPRQVVESLKNGEKVQPEIFDNVTVFYSDIVGFTTIAKRSKPMQVVDLLNNLYGKFDGILAQYDVYKVETIGDAYVVSSGVPNRNGNSHAGEIATASIDIVCTIMTVPIPHLPDDKLLLRIGIHSGSVVAGVVGLKMPRYTLFGETMQIAANLEATSKPLHVQVSKYTINILNELGGYFYKRRGDREVCGRTITTYWLIGKAGYEKVLPDVDE